MTIDEFKEYFSPHAIVHYLINKRKDKYYITTQLYKHNLNSKVLKTKLLQGYTQENAERLAIKWAKSVIENHDFYKTRRVKVFFEGQEIFSMEK